MVEALVVLVILVVASVALSWAIMERLISLDLWVWIALQNAVGAYIIVRLLTLGLRYRRNLNAHEWLLCPRCEHDLRGLETDPLICPECGREWSAEQILRSWEMFTKRKPTSQRG